MFTSTRICAELWCCLVCQLSIWMEASTALMFMRSELVEGKWIICTGMSVFVVIYFVTACWPSLLLSGVKSNKLVSVSASCYSQNTPCILLELIVNQKTIKLSITLISNWRYINLLPREAREEDLVVEHWATTQKRWVKFPVSQILWDCQKSQSLGILNSSNYHRNNTITEKKDYVEINFSRVSVK